MNKKKINTETIFETIKDLIKDTNVYWCDELNGKNKVFWKIHDLFLHYDGKYDFDSLIYEYFGSQLDTAVRPYMYSVVKFLATINGYGSGCYNNSMNNFQILFMTGVKKSQIKSVCKAFCEGVGYKSDCKEMEKILTKYFCEMSIKERIDDLKEELKYCIARK